MKIFNENSSMIENDKVSVYFRNLFSNLYSQNNLIKINIGNQQFTTSRPLLISHSQKLKEIFGDIQKDIFVLEENLDPNAFGEFINFVNSRNINFNRCQFDKLLEIYQFCQAPLYRDYLAINAPSLAIQFDMLSTYENEGLSTDFIIIKLASQVKNIIEIWDKVHDINSHHLIRVLQKSNLSQISPNSVFNFVNDTIHKRKDNPSKIIGAFNLTVIPFEDLIKLQKEAEKNDVFVPFFTEIKMNENFMKLISKENENLMDKITYKTNKNVKAMSSIEFKMVESLKNSADIQAVTKAEPKITFNLLLIGKENVGKTSLIYRFFIHEFNEKKIVHKMPISHYNYSTDLSSINIIDIGSSSDFDDVRDTSIVRSQFFLFLCSLDDEKSIEYIEKYYQKICQIKGTSFLPALICINKIDLPKPNNYNYLYLKSFALSINADLIEISVKSGKNIHSLFDKASEKYSKNSFNAPIFIHNQIEDS